MSKKSDCNIVKDLLPTYIDGLCSKESKEFIEDHLRNCVDCKEVFEMMQDEIKVEDLGSGKKEEELTIDQKKIINSVREKMQQDIRRKTNFYRIMCVAIIILVLIMLLPIKSIPKNKITFHSQSYKVKDYMGSESVKYSDIKENTAIFMGEGIDVDDANFHYFDSSSTNFEKEICMEEKWISENEYLTIVDLEATYPIKKYSYSIEVIDGKKVLMLNKAKTSVISGEQEGKYRVTIMVPDNIDECKVN